MNPTALTLCFLTLLVPSWLGSETNDGSAPLVAHGFTSQSMISSLPTVSKSLGSETPRRRKYGYYAATDEEQKSAETEIETINKDWIRPPTFWGGPFFLISLILLFIKIEVSS